MSKIAVIYWSQTGNTEAMANAVAEGVQAAGAEAQLIAAGDFNADAAGGFDAFAFGCPSMGVEVLEEEEFQPMWNSVKNSLGGKKTALFGSYGWGDGEWMRNWEADCNECGIALACESVLANEMPGDEDIEKCKALGAALV